ncbi:MAG TPA: citramalate synthase [bacterium]|nr:citramalate synthase [bacterium]HQL61923.1 citramalate synthase [bacterium]
MGQRIEIFDTTLRDGTQGEGVNLSAEDKIRIAVRLDEFGVDFIEGGWPGSNPKDVEFFRNIHNIKLSHAKITAFGSTRHAKYPADQDPNLLKMIESGTEVVTIFGKTWDLHVTAALQVDLNTNLEMIRDSVAFLKKNGRMVIYDAEHYFDGCKGHLEYALKTIRAAQEAGADRIVLCDTNGGSLPHEIAQYTREAAQVCSVPLGIHCHNDSGLAVANSLIAVQNGVTHVQGTINGYGERCGNADLCVVIPNLVLKLGYEAVREGELPNLTGLSRYIEELANLPRRDDRPFVGMSAFAHKGGIHVSAVQRESRTYEHIDPKLVGNRQRILVSELSGRSNVIHQAKLMGIDLEKSREGSRIVQRIKEMENQGYFFEAADGSLELLIRRELGQHRKFFETISYRVIVEDTAAGNLWTEATVRVRVNGDVLYEVSDGDGPINALDTALRKALTHKYPQLSQVRLHDYKVRIINSQAGTAAKTRVLIESGDGERDWITIGVSENIIEASWEALMDSIDYRLLLDELKLKGS